jgi:hypothetical protein
MSFSLAIFVNGEEAREELIHISSLSKDFQFNFFAPLEGIRQQSHRNEVTFIGITCKCRHIKKKARSR